MKYKYNSRLELQHVAISDRLASYFSWNESLILVKDEDYKQNPNYGNCYIIASFDKHGFCNNASSQINHDKAWDEFYRIMQAIRSEPKPENRNGDHSTDDE